MFKNYNTQQIKLRMPEYGRHIQKMAEYINQLPSKEERNQAAKNLIQVMSSLHHGINRESQEFKQRIWDHLAIISDHQLDIDYPVDIIPKDKLTEKPKKVNYAENNIKYKHYGKSVEKMITKIMQIENEEEKNVYIELLANYMKKLYLIWNKEAVNDDVIFKDITDIFGKDISISPDLKLSETKDILHKVGNINTNTTPNNNNRRHKKQYRKR